MKRKTPSLLVARILLLFGIQAAAFCLIRIALVQSLQSKTGHGKTLERVRMLVNRGDLTDGQGRLLQFVYSGASKCVHGKRFARSEARRRFKRSLEALSILKGVSA